MRPRSSTAFALILISAGLPAVVPLSALARPRAVTAAPAGIAVDVSRLRALGLGPVADLVQVSLARELAASGARVAVRITGLSMNSYVGSGSGAGGGGGGSGAAGGGGGDYDYLEGDVLTLGPRGEIVSQRHQVVSSPASSGGAYYLPGAEQRRVEAISRAFADWARRAG